MKKRCLLIVSLIIIFVSYNFIIQKHQRKALDEAFTNNLSEAYSCFAEDYSKFNEEDKISYYMKAAASLNTALYILPSTSYAKNKNNSQDLQNALSGLYLSITLHTTPQSTNRYRAFNEKEHDISKCLHYISVNPNDNNNCKALVKITEDIGY